MTRRTVLHLYRRRRREVLYIHGGERCNAPRHHISTHTTHEQNIHPYTQHIREREKMRTIAIVNRRGGVGKTATAHAVGAGIAHRGKRVLFVDLDSQTNLTFDVGAQATPPGSMELLSGSATAREAIQYTPGGDIIPATPSLAAADTAIDGTGKEYRLREALEEVESLYDYCITDTPPALGVLTVNALTAANDVIIPAQAEIHSLQGMSLLHETIEAVQKYTNRRLNVLGILITRYNGRTTIARDMTANIERVAYTLHTKAFNTPIRECVSVKEAQAVQQDIFKYAPKSNAATDYNALIDEILKER